MSQDQCNNSSSFYHLTTSYLYSENSLLLVSHFSRYHIIVNRVGNIGHLSVMPSNSEGRSGMLQPTESKASTPGFSKMDFLPSDTVWVGEC